MLVEVADRVRSVVRATDIPCRVGGDEFAVILPESSRDDAELLADRIALAIRSQKIEKVGALKISAGVAELRPEDTAADLFKRADHALSAPRTPARPGSSRADPAVDSAAVPEHPNAVQLRAADDDRRDPVRRPPVRAAR